MSASLQLISALLWGLAAGLLAWKIFSSSSQAMANYRSTFIDTASDNMADMFVFIDPGKIFYFNMLALVLSFPLVWLMTGSILIGLGLWPNYQMAWR